ncbi:hypothetical protein AUR64_15305 [Haloprofundus marisrubri]|uniref:Uncharacterized protein n=1 Tax=Haloprofundus marisrubri TaxID=1514971 RepID=A0A0W1R6Z3_9EURY|nr:hypothetical protein AUR64_15305 [Haloprofundus marisrubri]
MYVRPSAERAEMGDSIEFSLVNRTNNALFFGPYHWEIWRESEERWTNADSRDYVEDLGAEIESGDEYSWTVPIDTDGDRTMNSGRAGVGLAFESGRYCFGIGPVEVVGGRSHGTVGALFEVV